MKRRSASNRPPLKLNGRVLAIYIGGVFLGALDMSILAPAFPLIARHFAVSLTWNAWTVTTYTVLYTAATVLAGAAGDRYGRRNLFGIGVIVFGLGSLLAALAPRFAIFLAARAIQGAGAGAIFPNAQAEGIQLFPRERRGMALGIFGATFGLASIIGPNVGGWLAQHWGWQTIFWVNVPLALLVLAQWPRLPVSAVGQRRLPDWRGGLLFAGSTSAVLLAITLEGGSRWLWAILAVFLIAGFVRTQSRSKEPFLNTKALTGRGGVALYAGASLVGIDMASLVFVPFLAQQQLHFSVEGSGFVITPMAVAGAALAGLGGVLIDRLGAKPIVQIGMLAWFLGALTLAWSHLSLGSFIVAMSLFGLGTAFTMGAPLNQLALALYPEHQAGEALSLMAVFRSTGIAAGPVLLSRASQGGGFSLLFAILAATTALGLLLFSLLPAERPSGRLQTAAEGKR